MVASRIERANSTGSHVFPLRLRRGTGASDIVITVWRSGKALGRLTVANLSGRTRTYSVPVRGHRIRSGWYIVTLAARAQGGAFRLREAVVVRPLKDGVPG
jgi:hypothetical protein